MKRLLVGLTILALAAPTASVQSQNFEEIVFNKYVQLKDNGSKLDELQKKLLRGPHVALINLNKRTKKHETSDVSHYIEYSGTLLNMTFLIQEKARPKYCDILLHRLHAIKTHLNINKKHLVSVSNKRDVGKSESDEALEIIRESISLCEHSMALVNQLVSYDKLKEK
jgi:hypothetical protein